MAHTEIDAVKYTTYCQRQVYFILCVHFLLLLLILKLGASSLLAICIVSLKGGYLFLYLELAREVICNAKSRMWEL